MTKFLTLSASQRLMLPSWTAKLSHGCRVKITSSLLTSQPVQPVILVQREQWSPLLQRITRRTFHHESCQLLNQNRINYNFLTRGCHEISVRKIGYTAPFYRRQWINTKTAWCLSTQPGIPMYSVRRSLILLAIAAPQPCSLPTPDKLTVLLFLARNFSQRAHLKPKMWKVTSELSGKSERTRNARGKTRWTGIL